MIQDKQSLGQTTSRGNDLHMLHLLEPSVLARGSVGVECCHVGLLRPAAIRERQRRAHFEYWEASCERKTR